MQIGRLRGRLAEYYRSDGADDPILIEIPKGKYTLLFRKKRALAGDEPNPSRVDAGATPWIRRAAMAFLAVIALVLVLDWVLPSISRAKTMLIDLQSKRSLKSPGTALETFWAPFIQAPEGTTVVFRNIDFVGDADTGMRRFDPARDRENPAIQEYTGIGEVIGLLELHQLFEEFGRSFRAKPTNLLAPGDALDREIIFVGYPGAVSGRIPSTHEFAFRRIADGPHHTKFAIVDTHSKSSRVSIDATSSEGCPNCVDQAILALEHGRDHSHWTLYLEGTSTAATQASVDFMCNEDSVAALLSRLHITNATGLKPFEGLLQVKIANRVPIQSDLVDLREVVDARQD